VDAGVSAPCSHWDYGFRRQDGGGTGKRGTTPAIEAHKQVLVIINRKTR